MANFIAQATAHNKGGLRRALHAKPGEPIPAAKLERAEHSKNPKRRKEAVLAATLRRLSKGR